MNDSNNPIVMTVEIQALKDLLELHKTFFSILENLTINAEPPDNLYAQLQMLMSGMQYYKDNWDR